MLLVELPPIEILSILKQKNDIKSIPNRHPILDFYKDSTILVTGGTGFVGKVLIYKLLTSMKVKKVYMLIRVKDNLNAEERLQNFFKESVFNTIRESCPELFEKVYPVHADYNAPDLAISANDTQLIINEVEIVFNVVASVKFNEKLADAIDINVLGTNKILNLTMKILNLKSFLHISTLYCNCDRSNIRETVLNRKLDMKRILDNETLEKFSHCLIGTMPNTYTMTKKCSENLVNHKAFYLPAGIFRPPI
uniref:Fatty acyl-CoA reductase n=1 Tax=Megaselia scalaris TaxID=36166 RepID=T1GLR4_MEGSC